ncbi:hypothetical protein BT96DRAFT_1023223 [Gymnopus androsaceus JB14]|uniref:Uncharacterized protein n=1 Tax=Gymnopus androsaceus JB14 TaxID=1447944 RepID=A0A6A4H5T8_9AGAR|nr:hypothetical protein BT96DRAFT_1023223 [Gymnopus androsaceus JB14]
MHCKPIFLALILGLVSIACAVPLHTDSAPPNILDETSRQGNAFVVDKVPERLESMIKEFVTTSLDKLVVSKSAEWQFLAYDNSYQDITEDSPVYFEFTGGPVACRNHPRERPCLAFVGKDSGGSLRGIVNRPAGNIIVKGAALLVTGVSFTRIERGATGLEKFDAHTHAQAESMVSWSLNQQQLKTHLMFQSAPIISFSNQFPYDSIPLGAAVRFQFFGGKLCTLYQPCHATQCSTFEIGTSLAGVSFTKPPVPQTFEAMADTLAKRLVNWLLEQPNVFRGLGFSKSPIVINLDQFPYETIEKESSVHFQLYGGTEVHTSQALLCPRRYRSQDGTTSSSLWIMHEKFLPDLDAI